MLGLARGGTVEGRAGRVAAVVPEVEAVGGLVLESPRAIVQEGGHGAVPAPVDRVEAAHNGLARERDVLVPVLQVAAARRLGDVGREAVDLAVREAVAREEVGRWLAERVAALDADVDARGGNVCRIDVRGAIRARTQGVLRRSDGGVIFKVAVVARGGEAHVGGVAAVDLDDLLEATEGEDAGGVQVLGRQVEDVRRDARDLIVGDRGALVRGPLLVGDEERVRDAGRAPLEALLEVGRAQGLHDPVGARGQFSEVDGRKAAAAVGVGVREVRRGRAAVLGRVVVALGDELALEVVRGRDRVAGALDDGDGRVVVVHEICQARAVVVDVHDVRAREGGAVGVDDKGEGLVRAEGAVRLGLPDDADRGRVEQVRPHAVRHADEHVAGRRVVLADGAQHLDFAERVAGVARVAIGDDGRGRVGGIGRLADLRRVGADWLEGRHDRLGLGAEQSEVGRHVQELIEDVGLRGDGLRRRNAQGRRELLGHVGRAAPARDTRHCATDESRERMRGRAARGSAGAYSLPWNASRRVSQVCWPAATAAKAGRSVLYSMIAG